MKKKVLGLAALLLASVGTFCFISVAKADDTGTMALSSVADVAWSGYTSFGKPNVNVQYNWQKGSGNFFTRLQSKTLFGYKVVRTSPSNSISSSSKSVTHMFPSVGKGKYRFESQWKSGDFKMSYKTYSNN